MVAANVVLNVEIKNTPASLDKEHGYVVVRLDTHSGVQELWYYGTYESRKKANEAAIEIGNGIVLGTVGGEA